jgi:hypothetical protein
MIKNIDKFTTYVATTQKLAKLLEDFWKMVYIFNHESPMKRPGLTIDVELKSSTAQTSLVITTSDFISEVSRWQLVLINNNDIFPTLIQIQHQIEIVEKGIQFIKDELQKSNKSQ